MVITYDMAPGTILSSDDEVHHSATLMPVGHPTALSAPSLALQTLISEQIAQPQPLPADLAIIDADSFIDKQQ